jgi:hypothetical protein
MDLSVQSSAARSPSRKACAPAPRTAATTTADGGSRFAGAYRQLGVHESADGSGKRHQTRLPLEEARK